MEVREEGREWRRKEFVTQTKAAWLLTWKKVRLCGETSETSLAWEFALWGQHLLKMLLPFSHFSILSFSKGPGFSHFCSWEVCSQCEARPGRGGLSDSRRHGQVDQKSGIMSGPLWVRT